MADQDDISASGRDGAAPGTNTGTARRRVLVLGAVAASSVVTVRPALAQAAGSVLNCQIPIPDDHHAGQYIQPDGTVSAKRTAGSVDGPGRPLTGEEAKKMIRDGATPRGMTPEARDAYVKYMQRLQHGQSGFTCYASLQMPRA